jgi:hypothetical protein
MKEHEKLIEHISIELMIANPITKALLTKQYRDHMNCMWLANLFDI